MGISAALGSSALLPAGLGFRNLIINGGMDVWQRGTSGVAIAATASSSFRADRWTTYRSVAGSTQSQISPSLDGFQYALRIQRDSGNTATNTIYAGTSLETSTATKLVNKPVVLSFYARAGSNYSAASGGLAVLLSSGTGTETNGVYNAFTSATSVISTTATLTTSWQRFIYYGTMPATSTQLLVQFGFTPVGTASTNDYFDITGVQLEQNYQPTPFEQRPIGVELALCQRYYQRHKSNSAYGQFSWGSAPTTTAVTTIIPYVVPLRAAPTTSNFEYSNVAPGDGANVPLTPSAASLDHSSSITSLVNFTVTGATQYRPYFLMANNNSAGYVGFNLEL